MDLAQKAGGSPLRDFFIGKGAQSGCPFHRFNHRVVEDVKAAWGLGRQAFRVREPLLSAPGQYEKPQAAMKDATIIALQEQPAHHEAAPSSADFYRVAMGAKMDDLRRPADPVPGQTMPQDLKAEMAARLPESFAMPDSGKARERPPEAIAVSAAESHPTGAIRPAAAAQLYGKPGTGASAEERSPVRTIPDAVALSPRPEDPPRLEASALPYELTRTIPSPSTASQPSLPRASAGARRPDPREPADIMMACTPMEKPAKILESTTKLKNIRAGKSDNMAGERPSSVSAYIASAPASARAKLRELRKAIRRAAPKAIERISYGMPYYHLKGRLAYFRLATKHIGLYIPSPVLRMFKKELARFSTSDAALRLPLDKKLPVPLITRLVKARMKMNEELAAPPTKKGKPTRCRRGHRFYKSKEKPVCPVCWPGRYKKKKSRS